MAIRQNGFTRRCLKSAGHNGDHDFMGPNGNDAVVSEGPVELKVVGQSEGPVELRVVGHNCGGAMAAPTVEIRIELTNGRGVALSKVVELADLERLVDKARREALEMY